MNSDLSSRQEEIVLPVGHLRPAGAGQRGGVHIGRGIEGAVEELAAELARKQSAP